MKSWDTSVEIRYYDGEGQRYMRLNDDREVMASNAGTAARRAIALAFDELRSEVGQRHRVQEITATVAPRA